MVAFATALPCASHDVAHGHLAPQRFTFKPSPRAQLPGPASKSQCPLACWARTQRLSACSCCFADLDPARDGLGGPDHAFAISVTCAPAITLMDTLTIDLSELVSREVDIIWSYIASDNFKFQLSMSASFELSGLLASVPFLKDALEELLNAKGRASMNLYVDQSQAAIFLDLQGEIDILPELDIPPVEGELGVLLSVGYGGTADDMDIALVINGELYCLSAYDRGAGGLPDSCPPGTVQDGRKCYPPCTPGYSMDGPMCWQDCPADFSDDGAFCGKPGERG